MNITVNSGLGKEIGVYHSHIIPRKQEVISINQMLFKVTDVIHQVQDEQQTSVELEVMPVNQAASDYLGNLLNPSAA